MASQGKEVRNLTADIVIDRVVGQVTGRSSSAGSILEFAIGFNFGWKTAKFIHLNSTREAVKKRLVIAIQTCDEARLEYYGQASPQVSLEKVYRGHCRISPKSRLSA